jgi:hypothetical protein
MKPLMADDEKPLRPVYFPNLLVGMLIWNSISILEDKKDPHVCKASSMLPLQKHP